MTINMQKTLKQTKTKGKVVIDNISISYFNRNKNVYALRDISTTINISSK